MRHPIDPKVDYKHCYRMRNDQGRVFLDHGGIWLLELSKFAAETVETEQQRWLKFFKEAETLDDATLPPWMQTAEMQQAMSTLKQFSEKERAYHAYQARQNYLRVQASVQADIDEKEEKAMLATAEAERATAEAERATAEAERASAEAERERAARTAAEAKQAAAEAAQAAAEAEGAKLQAERDAANAELERLRRLLGDKPSQ